MVLRHTNMYHRLISAFSVLTVITFVRCQDPRIIQAVLNYPTVVEEFQDQVSALSEDASATDVFVRAQSLLDADWSTPSPYNVSERCLNDTFTMLAELGSQKWALKMVDATGKIPSGIYSGNLQWPGSFDECLAVVANVTSASYNTGLPFSGRHCMVHYTKKNASVPTPATFGTITLGVGLCVSDSCSAADVQGLVNTGLSLMPQLDLNDYAFIINCSQTLEYDTKVIVILVVCGVFALILAAGTLYDIYIQCNKSIIEKILDVNGDVNSAEPSSGDAQTYISSDDNKSLLDNSQRGILYSLLGQDLPAEPGMLGKILLSFSVYSNGKKILNTKQTAGTLTAVHGMRFLSLIWVILGHTYVFGLGLGDNLLPFMMDVFQRFTFQAVMNGTYSVDSFFFLSGMLVTFLTLKEMAKNAGKLNWAMFYFHRFWRLTPPYMLILMVYVPLFPYLANGPFWPLHGTEPDDCSHWWTNLLYINNIVATPKMCMAWSWYLSNDMQFYILSPLIIIPFYYSTIAGTVVLMAFMVATLVSTGLIASAYNIGVGITAFASPDYFQKMYITPWCRIGPYLIGIATGFLLYKTKCQYKMSWIVSLSGWCASTAIALSVLFGLYHSTSTGVPLTPALAYFYNAVSRTCWAMSLAWVIFSCATGNGGYVNTILSWKGFIPLSRLSYCAYLLHPILMFIYYYSRKTMIHFTDSNMIMNFFGFMTAAYALAFIVSLAFESPMMGLERVIFKREKQS